MLSAFGDDLLRERFQRILVADVSNKAVVLSRIYDIYPRAIVAEQIRNALSDAACAAGHNRCPSLKHIFILRNHLFIAVSASPIPSSAGLP